VQNERLVTEANEVAPELIDPREIIEENDE
jgi:hypothetical protein